MSVDLQVIFPQEAVTLSAVRFIPESGMLDITGQDFSAVDEVIINDRVADQVVVVSPTRLLSGLPDGVSALDVTTVAVLSRRLTITPRSILRFTLGRTPSMVTGLLKLVQFFLKVLFTTPGQDVFTQDIGGGALRNLGETFGAGQSGKILSDFVVAVDTAKRQIIALQSRNPSLPRDERLLSARVLSSAFDRNSLAFIISIEIASQAGRTATANVVA